MNESREGLLRKAGRSRDGGPINAGLHRERRKQGGSGKSGGPDTIRTYDLPLRSRKECRIILI
jgi:hypothetical protein